MDIPSLFEGLSARFRTDRAKDLNCKVRIHLSGEPSFEYTVCIQNGEINVSTDPEGEASSEVWASSEDYLAMELGELNPQMALMTGKVKVSNLAEMMRFTSCFSRLKLETLEGSETDKDKSDQVDFQVPKGPLNRIKILDFTHLLPGPLATKILADMGAEVYKIEDPERPDMVRGTPPFDGDSGMLFRQLNHNKYSLGIRYRSLEGKKLIEDLVKNCDVLIEQYRPGAMIAWGLGYEDLKTINPKLVYASISGYGQDGPLHRAAGHDLNYLSLSGILEMNRYPGELPVIPGVQIADISGGAQCAVQGILAALLQVKMGGTGSHVDVSMLDGLRQLTHIPLSIMQGEGREPEAGNEMLSGQIARYRVYKTSDDKYVAFGALEPKFWEAFCLAIDKPDWIERIMLNSEEEQALIKELTELFLSKDRDHWTKLGLEADCCLTPVLTLKESIESNIVRDRSYINDEKFIDIANPIRFSDQEHGQQPSLSASLGKHTTHILKKIGYQDEAIAQLRSVGTIN